MAKRQTSLFGKIETEGTVKSLNINPLCRITTNNWSGGGLFMSPYSEYIPLSYLFCNMNGFGSTELYKAHFDKIRKNGEWAKWKKQYSDKLFSGFAWNSISISPNRTEALKNLNDSFTNWLKNDNSVSILNIADHSYWSNTREWVGSNIMNTSHYTHQRSYDALTHLYTMFLGNRRTELIPHVLAVVLPENYLYMKYKMLVDNELDLSKIIILVNNELDTPRFPVKPFRKFYRDFMLPKIMESSCDVWRVPLDYIVDNCFLGEYSLKGMKMMERRQAIETIIESFKESVINDVKTPQTANRVISSGRGILEQIRDSPTAYTYTTGSGNIAVGMSTLEANYVTSVAPISNLPETGGNPGDVLVDYGERYIWDLPQPIGGIEAQNSNYDHVMAQGVASIAQEFGVNEHAQL